VSGLRIPCPSVASCLPRVRLQVREIREMNQDSHGHDQPDSRFIEPAEDESTADLERNLRLELQRRVRLAGTSLSRPFDRDEFRAEVRRRWKYLLDERDAT